MKITKAEGNAMTPSAKPWKGLGIEIDDELEVVWRKGSARSERKVWVLFTDPHGTPMVTAERWLVDANPLPLHFDIGLVWPLIDGDLVTSVRKGGARCRQ